MPKTRFDPETLEMFREISRSVVQISNSLKNQDIPNAAELKNVKKKLQAERKNFLKRFYEESSKNLINNAESLITRIENFDIKKIRKE